MQGRRNASKFEGGLGVSNTEQNLIGFPLVFYMAKFGRANEHMGSETPTMYTWILCRVLTTSRIHTFK